MATATITADGDFCEQLIGESEVDIELIGNFGGGTVDLMVQGASGSWGIVASYTDEFIGVADFYKPQKLVRFTVSGSTGASIEAAILS